MSISGKKPNDKKETGLEKPSLFSQKDLSSRELQGVTTNVTGRGGINRLEGITSTSRAFRTSTLDVAFNIGISSGRASALLVFKSPLFLGAVNLAQVVDTGVFLSGGTGFNEVRNRDGSQQSDDCDHDHDFHEGEARLTIRLDLHSTFLSFVFYAGRERGKRRLCY
jgi:hypothetical protein